MAQRSYGQYHGYFCHVEGGHGVLGRDYIMGPTTILMQQPCPVGLPETLTVAHVGGSIKGGGPLGYFWVHIGCL